MISHNYRRRAASPARSIARAFSLLELIIVIAIIGMLAALVLPNLFGASEDAKIQTTKTQMNNLAGSVESFRSKFNRYPTEAEGLDILLEQPASLLNEAGLDKSQVFLQRDVLPQDGWGNPFVYKIDENHGFTIISYGSDGQPSGEGNAADIDLRKSS